MESENTIRRIEKINTILNGVVIVEAIVLIFLVFSLISYFFS